MNRFAKLAMTALVAGALGACANEAEENATKVDASGKSETSLDALPDDVRAAVMEARPGFTPEAAEHETRNGADYYDVSGRLRDGTEIEFDLTLIDGVWTIVEIQRDILESEVPTAVLDALQASKPDFRPTRIIESDQGDGVVIYEFYQGAGETIEKAEVKYEADAAEFLDAEWVH